jgi:hypothetical protein
MLAWIEGLKALTDDEARERLLALEPGWETHHNWPGPGMTVASEVETALNPPEPVAAPPLSRPNRLQRRLARPTRSQRYLER